MNLEERIEMAIKPEIEVWHSEHDPSMYRQKHEMAGQLIEFQDGFEKGYMAAMRSLFADLDLDMSECIDYEWYWILTDDGWHHAMRVDFGFDIVSPGGDDLLFSCGQEDVRRVLEGRLPSPAEIFGNQTN